MRLLTTAILAGAATAALAPLQQPLHMPKQFSAKAKSTLEEQLTKLKTIYHDLTPEAIEAWNTVASLYPEQLHAAFAEPPARKYRRHPDSAWDYIKRGADVQKIWIKGKDGEQRYVDGRLEEYDLRVKKVDPSVLGVDPGVKQYSGYLDDKKNDKHLFYWFFESRNDPENDPVVLWLNGGPGCSSLTGLFMELGPARINKNLEVENNPYSWNSNASVIFLDQPVGTGFSYSGSDVSDTVTAGKDVYALLTLFFEQFPEYAAQDFHIAGESYGGHYIPVFTSEILKHKNRNINLKSILIGNGLTDGYNQYPYYRPMACGEGGWPAVLDKSTCQEMDNSLGTCQSMIKLCYDTESAWLCVPASIYCNNNLLGPYQQTGQNPYDVREKCEDQDNLCYTATAWIAQWLNQADVQKALGVETQDYTSCNFDVNRNFLFAGDWMMPYHRVVPGILEQIPVLIYAGDADFICNWLGNKAWTEALKWPGQEKYAAAKMENLYITPDDTETQIGAVKSSGNFTFIQIHAAGHMVPLNQPEASLAMLNRWIGGEWMN